MLEKYHSVGSVDIRGSRDCDRYSQLLLEVVSNGLLDISLHNVYNGFHADLIMLYAMKHHIEIPALIEEVTEDPLLPQGVALPPRSTSTAMINLLARSINVFYATIQQHALEKLLSMAYRIQIAFPAVLKSRLFTSCLELRHNWRDRMIQT
jgi:hypothetical protein